MEGRTHSSGTLRATAFQSTLLRPTVSRMDGTSRATYSSSPRHEETISPSALIFPIKLIQRGRRTLLTRKLPVTLLPLATRTFYASSTTDLLLPLRAYTSSARLLRLRRSKGHTLRTTQADPLLLRPTLPMILTPLIETHLPLLSIPSPGRFQGT